MSNLPPGVTGCEPEIAAIVRKGPKGTAGRITGPAICRDYWIECAGCGLDDCASDLDLTKRDAAQRFREDGWVTRAGLWYCSRKCAKGGDGA